MEPIPIRLEDYPEICIPAELRGIDLFVTDRKLVGKKKWGIGQHVVEINGKFWVNELYVRTLQP